MPRLGRAILLGAMLLASSATVTWAQGGGAFHADGFVCVIDLAENALPFDSSRYPSGIVSTRDSKKVCTPSANPNVNIECKAQIAGWQGGEVNLSTVACVINTAPCGQGGQQPVTAHTGELSITAGGAAILTCGWK